MSKCISRKDIQLLVRKFFKDFNLNVCFLFSIEHRRDTCEASHSNIYLQYLKSFLHCRPVVCHRLPAFWKRKRKSEKNKNVEFVFSNVETFSLR
jgi:hypothetical protein